MVRRGTCIGLENYGDKWPAIRCRMVDQTKSGTRASCPKFGGNPIQKLMRRFEIQIRNHFATTLFLVPWFGAGPNFFTVEIVKWINIIYSKIFKLHTEIGHSHSMGHNLRPFRLGSRMWGTCLIIPDDPMHSTLRGKTPQKLTNVDPPRSQGQLAFSKPRKMED